MRPICRAVRRVRIGEAFGNVVYFTEAESDATAQDALRHAPTLRAPHRRIASAGHARISLRDAPPRKHTDRKKQANDTMSLTNLTEESLRVNVPDVALIFEGGGMRASHSAGAVVTLLERGINFGHVYGISAGSSHTVNYVSRDARRAKASFVDLVRDPHFGGIGSFLAGRGYFNAPHLYEGIIADLAGTDEVMAFDWDAFSRNPAHVHIEGFDWDTGATVAWTKADMPTPHDMAIRVRASSSMPIFMPPTRIADHAYLDGGMGTSWGICLEAARRDGFERFFVVRTQSRGYRKGPVGPAGQRLFRTVFRKHPLVAERTIERWQHYNALCGELEQLEREGAAYVFYPETMSVTNRETEFGKLQASYEQGYAQAQREADAWEAWLQR